LPEYIDILGQILFKKFGDRISHLISLFAFSISD
jgi:hypothetical protein